MTWVIGDPVSAIQMNDLQKIALQQALTKTEIEDCEDVFDYFVKLLHNYVDAEKALEGR